MCASVRKDYTGLCTCMCYTKLPASSASVRLICNENDSVSSVKREICFLNYSEFSRLRARRNRFCVVGITPMSYDANLPKLI